MRNFDHERNNSRASAESSRVLREVHERRMRDREASARPQPEPLTREDLLRCMVTSGAQPPTSMYRRLVYTAMAALAEVARLKAELEDRG